jgi:hypothetical protein
MAGYITAQKLRVKLGLSTYMAIFDDNSSGDPAVVDASAEVAQCLDDAHAETASFLPSIFDTTPAEQPSASVSKLLILAELGFACVFAYRRRPEYVKTFGADPSGPLYKEAVDRMLRIQKGTQQVAPNDNPPQKPGNAGGYVLADGPRIAATSADGTVNSGDL